MDYRDNCGREFQKIISVLGYASYLSQLNNVYLRNLCHSLISGFFKFIPSQFYGMFLLSLIQVGFIMCMYICRNSYVYCLLYERKWVQFMSSMDYRENCGGVFQKIKVGVKFLK